MHASPSFAFWPCHEMPANQTFELYGCCIFPIYALTWSILLRFCFVVLSCCCVLMVCVWLVLFSLIDLVLQPDVVHSLGSRSNCWCRIALGRVGWVYVLVFLFACVALRLTLTKLFELLDSLFSGRSIVFCTWVSFWKLFGFNSGVDESFLCCAQHFQHHVF